MSHRMTSWIYVYFLWIYGIDTQIMFPLCQVMVWWQRKWHLAMAVIGMIWEGHSDGFWDRKLSWRSLLKGNYVCLPVMDKSPKKTHSSILLTHRLLGYVLMLKVNFFKVIIQESSFWTCHERSLRWMLQSLVTEKSMLLQVMAWGH